MHKLIRSWKNVQNFSYGRFRVEILNNRSKRPWSMRFQVNCTQGKAQRLEDYFGFFGLTHYVRGYFYWTEKWPSNKRVTRDSGGSEIEGWGGRDSNFRKLSISEKEAEKGREGGGKETDERREWKTRGRRVEVLRARGKRRGWWFQVAKYDF